MSSKFWKFLLLAAFMCLPATSFSQSENGNPKFLGNIIGRFVPKNFGKYWDQVTPENAGKWGFVAMSQDTNSWNWSILDSIYDYAVSKGYPFKFHNLIWRPQQPRWMHSIDSIQQKEIVASWIRLCGERYPKTAMVDVVNEPLHQPAFYKNAIGGDGNTGWDWVIWAFEKAKQAFPKAKLLINDYGILNDSANTHKYIQIINLLKARNLIDGIGCQGHGLEKTDTSIIRSNLKLLEATGLPIFISEYDVNESSDAEQLAIFEQQFPIFWNDAQVEGITMWGYIQHQTWIPFSYLVRVDGTERPALDWLQKYASSHR
ncbi:MAG: endo-1,4-beta-xylanase [Candidatus Kryptoniota bacterium]